MAKFPLTEMAVNMFCPGNVVQLDDAGLPSLLVWIPAFKNSEVLNGGDDSIHPAFIVNGKQIPGFYYSKYQNVIHNGKAYSLPAEDPATYVSFDSALEYCEAKGYGWHMSTAAEWAAIALWCKKNGFLPYGNNDAGKDKRESGYKAIPTYKTDAGKTYRVATGTGPLTWSHDGAPSGIWDLNGNGWEWQGGIRLVWGELQILANNDAADPDNPQNDTSTCWKAINAADGSLVAPESKITDTAVKASGKTVKVDFLNNVVTYSTGITNPKTGGVGCEFANVTCTSAIGNAAKKLLRALALLPDDGAEASEYESDYMHWNNNHPERCVVRGSHWLGEDDAGVFNVHGRFSRTETPQEASFRSVYIPNI